MCKLTIKSAIIKIQQYAVSPTGQQILIAFYVQLNIM